MASGSAMVEKVQVGLLDEAIGRSQAQSERLDALQGRLAALARRMGVGGQEKDAPPVPSRPELIQRDGAVGDLTGALNLMERRLDAVTQTVAELESL